MSEISPYTHKCDVRDVDYSLIESGNLKCKACGATWVLNPSRGWQRQPTLNQTHRRNK